MFVENISSCPEGNWVQLVIQLVVDTVVEPHSKVEITPRWRAMAKQLIRDNKLPDMPLVDIDAGFYFPAKLSRPQKLQNFQLSLRKQAV
jgi:hypothetical protein